MKHSILEIDFETPYTEWSNIIYKSLEYNKIKNSKQLSRYIYSSLKQQCAEYLTVYGFPEYQTFHNKKEIVDYFSSYGLKIQIKSNRVLWIYLDTFTDITDYTNCFDISIKPVNYKLLTNKSVYIPYNNIVYCILHTNKDYNLPYIKGIRDALIYYKDNKLEQILKDDIQKINKDVI